MPTANIYNLYITDKDRNITLEERSVAVNKAEQIIREYPWRDEPQSNIQLWKDNSNFSFSIHYLEDIKKFRVGFSDKVSRFKLPLPYVGANYGLFDDIEDAIRSLDLFFDGEFEKLEQLLAKYRPEQKGD